MKHIISALLLVLCITTVGLATKWRPYVAAGGVMDIPSLDVAVEKFELRLKPSEYMYPGTQFDIGLRNGKHEWYATHHLSHAPQKNSYDSYFSWWSDSSHFWTRSRQQEFRAEQRFLIGHRFWLAADRSARMDPFIGAGVGLGSTRIATNQQTTNWEYLLDSTGTGYEGYRVTAGRETKQIDHEQAYGGLFEIGTAFPAWGRMDILVITQVHLYVIESMDRWGRLYDLQVMPSGVVQARYVFR